MQKKEERKELGYAESGSLKYPEMAPLVVDWDVLISKGIFERGWTTFVPQE